MWMCWVFTTLTKPVWLKQCGWNSVAGTVWLEQCGWNSVARSTQPLCGWLRGSAQPRTPDSTANLVFSKPTSLCRSECGQCTSCTGHPHGYNTTASALEDRNN